MSPYRLCSSSLGPLSRTASPARAHGPPRVRRSVPLPFREAAEGNEAHERDDEPHPEAPHDHQDDADDDEDATETDPPGVAACPTFCRHPLPPRRVLLPLATAHLARATA